MPVYIVRRAANHRLLGKFAVGDVDSMARQIRNSAEPEECEFCEIDARGILWPVNGVRHIPAKAGALDAAIDEVEDQEDPDPLRPLAGAVLTELWPAASYEESHSWQGVPAMIEADQACV